MPAIYVKIFKTEMVAGWRGGWRGGQVCNKTSVVHVSGRIQIVDTLIFT